MKIVVQRAAILNGGAAFQIAGAQIEHAALGIARFAGDDIDDAVDRIGAP